MHGRILFIVSLLFVALLDLFNPYSPFKFLIFINLVCLHFIGHNNCSGQVLIHIATIQNYTGTCVIMNSLQALVNSGKAAVNALF